MSYSPSEAAPVRSRCWASKMGLLQVAVVSVGLFGLLHWLILPWLRRKVAQRMPERPIRLIVVLLLLGILQSATFITTLIFGAIVTVLAVVSMLGGHFAADQLAAVFQALSAAHEEVRAIDSIWALVVIGLLTLALWISTRRDATREFSAAIGAALADLQSKADAGELPAMAPTPQMARVSAHIEDRSAELQSILMKDPQKEGSAD